MRAFAIFAIVLHNYYHWLSMTIRENEYNYIQSHVDDLQAVMREPTDMMMAHLLSFFGHYGVPVFVFLSAFGLVMKYEKGGATVPEDKAGLPYERSESAWTFIKKHYRKLFLMMMVGFSISVLVDYMTPHPHIYRFDEVIGQLLMLSNLYPRPDQATWPGPYWYFGLMVQLYVIYRLVLYPGKGSLCGMLTRRTRRIVTLLIFVVTLFGQLLFDPESNSLMWYRYNVFGSLPVFIYGMLAARLMFRFKDRKPLPQWLHWAVLVVSLIMIYALSLSFETWIIVPFAVCTASIAIAKLLPQRVMPAMEWLGGISSAMFVCHPITRKVFLRIGERGDIFTAGVLYIVATISIAILFRDIMARIMRKQV